MVLTELGYIFIGTAQIATELIFHTLHGIIVSRGHAFASIKRIYALYRSL